MRVALHIFRPEADEAKHLHDPVGSFLRVTDAVHEQRLATMSSSVIRGFNEENGS